MRRRFDLALLAALAAPPAVALDTPRDCRVIALQDSARAGQAVIGAEDVVYDASGERFLIAAFDRTRAADATARDGGLYSLPLVALAHGGAAIAVTPLALSGAPAFRPHGIDVSGDGETIVAIARQEWRGAAQRSNILSLRRDGAVWTPETVADGSAICRANDVAIADGDIVLSHDRGACGGLDMMIENVFALAQGSVLALSPGGQPKPVLGNLLVANGVLAHDGGLVIAETREDRILWLDPDRAPDDPIPETPLGASPDNINRAPDGGLLVTAHDSLFRLALHRSFGDAFAPPGGVVFHLSAADRGRDTPPEPLLRIAGDVFPGPTSAAAGGGVLLVGSATAAGVLACAWVPIKEDS